MTTPAIPTPTSNLITVKDFTAFTKEIKNAFKSSRPSTSEIPEPTQSSTSDLVHKKDLSDFKRTMVDQMMQIAAKFFMKCGETAKEVGKPQVLSELTPQQTQTEQTRTEQERSPPRASADEPSSMKAFAPTILVVILASTRLEDPIQLVPLTPAAAANPTSNPDDPIMVNYSDDEADIKVSSS
ncbi:hypothetical protein L6452_01831 [Arctium lappa]|uniref:Uncharacterized protein n=1 Tax=Arctium lappa TaxID=4217 RepID=A0ACB9FIJ1_ARCLA|nr:hypothetical protein L6452_01831 [Arctium lappa]